MVCADGKSKVEKFKRERCHAWVAGIWPKSPTRVRIVSTYKDGQGVSHAVVECGSHQRYAVGHRSVLFEELYATKFALIDALNVQLQTQ